MALLERGQALGLDVELALGWGHIGFGFGQRLGGGIQFGFRLRQLLLGRCVAIEGKLELAHLAIGQGGGNIGLRRQVVVALGRVGRGAGIRGELAGGLGGRTQFHQHGGQLDLGGGGLGLGFAGLGQRGFCLGRL